jgi:hypothetical protein
MHGAVQIQSSVRNLSRPYFVLSVCTAMVNAFVSLTCICGLGTNLRYFYGLASLLSIEHCAPRRILRVAPHESRSLAVVKISRTAFYASLDEVDLLKRGNLV